MATDRRSALASSFGSAATAYAAHRPDYAAAAIQSACDYTPYVS